MCWLFLTGMKEFSSRHLVLGFTLLQFSLHTQNQSSEAVTGVYHERADAGARNEDVTQPACGLHIAPVQPVCMQSKLALLLTMMPGVKEGLSQHLVQGCTLLPWRLHVRWCHCCLPQPANLAVSDRHAGHPSWHVYSGLCVAPVQCALIHGWTSCFCKSLCKLPSGCPHAKCHRTCSGRR